MNMNLNQAIKKTTTLLQETQHQWSRLMPPHVDADMMLGVFINLFKTNPTLLECEQTSLWSAIAQCCKLGLRPDGLLGEAYMIPYGHNGKLVIGYKGLLALARRSGEVAKISTAVVREGDHFEYTLGDEEKIVHSPTAESDSPITHAYVIVTLTNGEKVRKVMTASEIEIIRSRYSKGSDKKSSPWNTSPDTMALKTVVRSLLNSGLVPMSISRQLLSDDGSVQPLDHQELQAIYDTEDKRELLVSVGDASVQ